MAEPNAVVQTSGDISDYDYLIEECCRYPVVSNVERDSYAYFNPFSSMMPYEVGRDVWLSCRGGFSDFHLDYFSPKVRGETHETLASQFLVRLHQQCPPLSLEKPPLVFDTMPYFHVLDAPHIPQAGSGDQKKSKKVSVTVERHDVPMVRVTQGVRWYYGVLDGPSYEPTPSVAGAFDSDPGGWHVFFDGYERWEDEGNTVFARIKYDREDIVAYEVYMTDSISGDTRQHYILEIPRAGFDQSTQLIDVNYWNVESEGRITEDNERRSPDNAITTAALFQDLKAATLALQQEPEEQE